MKKQFIVLCILALVIFSPVLGQEIYWDSGYYRITKNIIEDRGDEGDFYSLVLHDDDFMRIRMVYYGPRLFIIIDEKTSMYTDDIRYKDKNFKFILHYDAFIDNWYGEENSSDGEFVLYYNQRSKYFIDGRAGYEYLLRGLIINDGSLPGISYCVSSIGAMLKNEKNIPNIESLEIIFPDNTAIIFSTDYQRQAIQEIFRLASRIGLI